MPLFSVISSFNMSFDGSKYCNLMLFPDKSLTVIICNLCPFEHVLVISGDSSVFMFCHDLHVHHVRVFCFHVKVL